MTATVTASNVRPLARGPLSAGELAVLDAIAFPGSSTPALVAATGLTLETVESALAHLSRRGLVRRTASHARRIAAHPAPGRRRALHLTGDGQPTPPLPAA
jgi:DNA-binding MarR family transcriptional regulator